jgi:hypothetical protein
MCENGPNDWLAGGICRVIIAFRTVLALLATAVLAAAPAFAADLQPHTASYKVKISIVSGRLDTELRATADGYVAHHVIKPVGLSRLLTNGTMDVTSEFGTDDDGVRPVVYHAVDTIRDDPEERIHFDWSAARLTGTVGEQDIALDLDGDTYDNVSIQYELMHDLLNGGPEDTYVIFDADEMRVANVANAGTKTVRTKAGSFEVVGVRHQKAGSSRITTLWCAADLGYLPVIIEQHRKGKLNFRATLTSYTPT